MRPGRLEFTPPCWHVPPEMTTRKALGDVRGTIIGPLVGLVLPSPIAAISEQDANQPGPGHVGYIFATQNLRYPIMITTNLATPSHPLSSAPSLTAAALPRRRVH